MDADEVNFKHHIRDEKKEVFNEDELPKILKYLEENIDLRNLGILLMFLTGIRVGELVALKHSDFNGITFSVKRTETRIPLEGGGSYYGIKESPKTEAGIRNAIIPSEYAWVADKLKRYNPFGEFIFVENGKRLTTNYIRRRMDKICKILQIEHKSPHKARKTYASILLDNSIDSRLITDLMGHTDIICTEHYYHINRKSIEKKAEVISNIPEFKITSNR